MDGIFISYRRDDSAGYAGRLYDRLAAHFGADRVFMDVEGIEPGLDFVVAIEDAVGSCRVLIAVIGDEWTTATDAAGRRRLDDPNDFIRLETGSALQRGIRVVPVLVGGAVMPLAADLPDDLKALTRRQAIEINHKQWEASTGELIHTLEGILKAPSADHVPKEDKPQDPIPADRDGKVGTNGGKAKPAADDQRREDSDGKRWILPTAAVLALLAGMGLWLGQGERKPAMAPEAPIAGKPAEVPVAKPSRPLARVEREPVPEEKPPASPAPSPPAAAPAPAVKPESRPAAAVAAPLIREFKAESTARLARLCYRVSDAESLSLSPRPGELRNLTEDCVEVRIDGPTNFTLLARNGAKTVRKMLAVAPSGATAGTQTETPGAMPGQPAAAGRSAAGLPVKGERWVYKASGKWPTSFKQRFEILAQSVADSLVTDELRVLDGAGSLEQRRSRGSKPDFVAWTAIGMEFSPYFGAYVDLARQESLGSLPTPDYDPQWRDWHSKVEVLGRESVSVPAGTFDAFKVEVWSNRRQSGSVATMQVEPVRVRYTIWYAPQVKRYVRMQRTVVSANNSEIESDLFELVAHRGQ